MYQNRISLIGFTGKERNAHHQTRRFMPYSRSPPELLQGQKSGEYVSHTECIASSCGKAREFASSLKKGTHLLVEGQLRSASTPTRRTRT